MQQTKPVQTDLDKLGGCRVSPYMSNLHIWVISIGNLSLVNHQPPKSHFIKISEGLVWPGGVVSSFDGEVGLVVDRQPLQPITVTKQVTSSQRAVLWSSPALLPPLATSNLNLEASVSKYQP